MSKIAYILLCHKDPEGIIAQAERLTALGDYIAIHFDARAEWRDFQKLRDALGKNPNVVFARHRVKCGWGEWSLVAATLQAVRAAEAAFADATHFFMISGDCMPIKTSEFIHQRLHEDDVDYIENFDFFESDWIKTGLKEDRLTYRHFFNERGQKWLFYKSLELQRRFGLKRALPADLRIMIGSQWWCLRRRTIEAILHFCAKRPEIVRFFKTTWIPDETFFQSIVPHLVPRAEIRCRTPTFLMFSDYGMPINFYNDHHDMLLAQDFFFARKISPEARALKARLGDLFLETGRTFDISNEGHRLHGFLTGRGRVGRRFAPRIWEAAASIGRERVLYIIVCKKWHVAKRLAAKVREKTNLPVVEYLFTEDATPMPHLGGVETTLAKRARHRRSLLRMLFDHFGSQHLVICLDTSDIELIEDFSADRAEVRLLEVQCDFTDDYLLGHARRVGLAAAGTPDATLATLLPTVRFDVKFESDRLRDAGFERMFCMRQSATAAENAQPLAAFLAISPEIAQEIAATDYLFSD